MSVSGVGGPAGKREARVVVLMCLRNLLEYPLCPSAWKSMLMACSNCAYVLEIRVNLMIWDLMIPVNVCLG